MSLLLLVVLAQATPPLESPAFPYIVSAEVYMQNGQVDSALALLNQGYEETQAPEIFRYGAEMLARYGEDSLAEAWARRYLQLVPGDPEGLKILIRILLAEEKKEAALYLRRYREKAIPPDAAFLATAYDLLDRQAAADTFYIQALQEHPDSLELVLNYGSFLLRSGRPDSCVAFLERYKEQLSGHYQYELTLGFAYDALGEKEKAFQHLAQAQAKNPANFSILYKMAEILMDLQRYEEAQKLLNAAVAARPFDPLPRRLLGYVYFRMGSLNHALEQFSTAAQLQPEEAEIHYYLSRIFARLQMYDRALEAIDRAIALEKIPDYRVFRAFLLLQKGDTADAYFYTRYLLRRAYPQNPYLHGLMAELYRGRGDLRRALRHAIKAKDLEPENPRRWTFLAQLYFQRGEIWKGLYLLQEATDRFPENSDIWFYLGLLANEAGQQDLAVEAYEEAVRLDSTNAAALNNLGYLLAEQGIRLQEAKALIAKALALDPGNPIYLDSMGWVYFQMGEMDSAFRYIREAVEGRPTDPEILEHMGDVYMAQQMPEKALEYYQKALAEGPHPRREPILREKIQEVKRILRTLGKEGR